MVSPAEEMREAARVLRERAGAATPGPWRREYPDAPNTGIVNESGTTVVPGVVARHRWPRPTDAEHIAALHPIAALALAEWMDETAADMQHAGAVESRAEGLDGQPLVVWVPGDLGHHPAWTAALRLARTYLGRTT